MPESENKYRLVLIDWLDSFGCSASWTALDQCEPSALVCRSVGWLIHDDEDCKVVVPHISASEHANATQQGCGDMTIPSVAVLKMVDLEAVASPHGNSDG